MNNSVYDNIVVYEKVIEKFTEQYGDTEGFCGAGISGNDIAIYLNNEDAKTKFPDTFENMTINKIVVGVIEPYITSPGV